MLVPDIGEFPLGIAKVSVYLGGDEPSALAPWKVLTQFEFGKRTSLEHRNPNHESFHSACVKNGCFSVHQVKLPIGR